MREKKETWAWSVPLDVSDVPESGLHLELEADEAARSAVANLAGLTGISELQASFDLSRRGAGLHVAGRVSAEIGQTCVVTLEALTNRVDEEVDLVFLPGVSEPVAEGSADAEEEPPEPLVNGRVDLGVIATEFLMLGIDPYPRKEGAAFAKPKADDDAVHPFAALAALKKDPGGHT